METILAAIPAAASRMIGGVFSSILEAMEGLGRVNRSGGPGHPEDLLKGCVLHMRVQQSSLWSGMWPGQRFKKRQGQKCGFLMGVLPNTK